MVLIQFHRQSRKDGNYQQAEWEKQVGENVGKICQHSWIHMTTSVPIVAGCTIRKRTWTSRHTSANKRWNNRLLFHQFISTLFNYLSPPSPGFHCLIFINPLETKHTHTHTPKRQEPSQSISPCGGQGIYQNIHSPSFCLHFVADFSCKSKERPVIKRTTLVSAYVLQLSHLLGNRLTGFYLTSHI